MENNNNNNKILPLKHVEETVAQICNLYIIGPTNEITKYISDFYSKCSKESIRAGTMELIIKTHKSISAIKNADSSIIIQMILLEFERFSKLVEDDGNANVSHNLWDKSFKISVYQDITKCSTALNLLFQIQKPETEKRKDLIKFHVGKLMEKVNTVFNGYEWIKFINNIGIINDQEILKYVQEQILPKLEKNKKKSGENYYDQNYHFSNQSINFFSSYSPQLLRTVVLKLLQITFELSNNAKDSGFLVHGIFKSFENFLSIKDELFIKEVFSAKVTDDLWITVWEKCFKASFDRKIPKWFPILDQLFCLTNHESEERRLYIITLIEERIQKCLGQKNNFRKAVEWISILNLDEIKERNFENIVFNPVVFKKKLIITVFTTVEAKLRCLQILDDFLIRAENNNLQNELEEKFLETITIEKLPGKIFKLINVFQIQKEERNNFHACRVLWCQKFKLIYNFVGRNYFELYSLDALKGKDEKRKLDFLEILSDDKKYAYCWAKYLQVQKQNFPNFLQNCEIYDSDAAEFIKTISKRINYPVDRDNIEICQFWKKSYQLITVITPEALKNFVNEYLVKADVIGIDCEAQPYQQQPPITVLQLASYDWICLIDIQELFSKLSPQQWIYFFDKLFDPSIIRIGFSFKNDYKFLCNRFPYLQILFQEDARKVLCLQHFTTILTSMKNDAIFNGKPPKGRSLAALSKSVLDIDMDKTLQCSNWASRPLTQFQKIYAVSDALIVVLIKEEIEKRLKEGFGNFTASKIMEKGYIIHYSEKEKMQNGRKYF